MKVTYAPLLPENIFLFKLYHTDTAEAAMGVSPSDYFNLSPSERHLIH